MPEGKGSTRGQKFSLRDLYTAMPTSEGSRAAVEEISSASDSAAAVLGANYVQSALRLRIYDSLKNTDEETLDRLTQKDGALSSFFCMITLAYAMGLISKEAAADLDCIRRIRNAFAHCPVPIDFTFKEIERECKKLSTHTRPKIDPMRDIREPTGRSKHSLPRRLFVHACIQTTMILAMETLGPERNQEFLDELKARLPADNKINSPES